MHENLMDIKDYLDLPPWEWPESAAKTFRAVLTNPSGKLEDRRIAAELAGNEVAINDDLANVLVSILRNAGEPAELRGQAAISLGPVLELYLIDEDDPDLLPIGKKTFQKITEAVHAVFLDESNPKLVRRRALEGAVRYPQAWHAEAIRTAYAGGDPEWKLTAVFGMRFVPGFNQEILEALESSDPEIQLEAVDAAGAREVRGAREHVLRLLRNPETEKDLLLTAIGAIGGIDAQAAIPVLAELSESEDEEIAEAAEDALAMAGGRPGDEDEEDEEDGEDEWIN